jgi:alanine-glyoxylate transaminase/serine-glyoxylate transaminase/serine-pyruvate transaminase
VTNEFLRRQDKWISSKIMPESRSADHLRKVILDRLNPSMGTGQGKVDDKVFRIGHLGGINVLMLAGTLVGV